MKEAMASNTMANNTSVEAKIVVLGTQGVGKTSLIHRYIKNDFIPPTRAQSTVGASFLTTKVEDVESSTVIRLQIWDTAGQERFRSISKLYYRGAHAAILCYDVTSMQSFEEMGRWLLELRDQCGVDGALGDMIIHVVGTKSDVVAADPKKRKVPFEKCIGYVAEQLYPETTKPTQARGPNNPGGMPTPNSNRSSGFWGGNETAWDCCYEVSAKDGEGIDEMFRVMTRKLVEQHVRRTDPQSRGQTPGAATSEQGYFDLPNGGNGSFRLGHGDKRRSWLGFPSTPGGLTSFGGSHGGDEDTQIDGHRNGRRCC